MPQLSFYKGEQYGAGTFPQPLHRTRLDTSLLGNHAKSVVLYLYPHNPHKTQNCVSIALTFPVEESKKEELINRVIEILKRDTLSDKTAIAILEGLDIPEKLKEYSIATKSGLRDVETAEEVAKELNIPLIAVTGQQGKVGALAALGLYNDVEEAVKAYDKK